MLNARSSLSALLSAPVRSGRIVWIGVRPARREPLVSVEDVMARAGAGLDGDHYAARGDGKRQVTVIQAEDLAAVASYLGVSDVPAALLRRNLVTRGINLLALRDRSFRVGNVLLIGTGECHPCSRMEEVLGQGGYNAVRGHGGITARVLESGPIRLGDEVIPQPIPTD